jgi:hypothetical protein
MGVVLIEVKSEIILQNGERMPLGQLSTLHDFLLNRFWHISVDLLPCGSELGLKEL